MNYWVDINYMDAADCVVHVGVSIGFISSELVECVLCDSLLGDLPDLTKTKINQHVLLLH